MNAVRLTLGLTVLAAVAVGLCFTTLAGLGLVPAGVLLEGHLAHPED
jgi:hypothetical protein